MRTVFHIIAGLGDGGAEAALYRLCKHDRLVRHHVVSLMDAGKYGHLLEVEGTAVTCLGMPRGGVTLTGLWRLWKSLRAERPDAIQTWMYHSDLLGGVIARLAGYRNVSWGVRHSDLIPGKSSRRTIAVAGVCAWISSLVPRRIICCAEAGARAHAALGYDPGRIRVVPNGYDLAVFRPNRESGFSIRVELGCGEQEPILGFVARYDPLKDHHTLLQALGLLKDRGHTPLCLLVGSGMDNDNVTLVDQITTLGLDRQVRLVGRRNDIPAVMNALDLHVMSSASEAFPNVLAEAMACGTPCISTDVGDASTIVGDSGWIVPPCNPEALALAIARALDERNMQNWADRQEAARRRIESRFSIESMVSKYHQIWFDDDVIDCR